MKVTIKKCARCRGNHRAMEAKRFRIPLIADGVTFNFWVSCPKTHDPILIQVFGLTRRDK